MGESKFRVCLLAITAGMFLAACGNLWGPANPDLASPPLGFSSTITLTPFQPEEALAPTRMPATPTMSQTLSTPAPSRVWISPAVPELLRQTVISYGLPLAATPDEAAARLDVLLSQTSIDNPAISTWFYALVTAFPETIEAVSLADIQNTWAGSATGPFAGRPLWMDATTLEAFTVLWGKPVPGSVATVGLDQLAEAAWSNRPSWAILPFEALEPSWKVLSVDGQSPVHNDFDPASYPLKIELSLQPAVFSLPPSNRDPKKLTVLAMTGVTALVRGTADRMERNGVLYPGEAIRDVLRSADLTHVSNEISFDPNCPNPDPWTDSLVFCSDPRYIALLEDVGVDLVELTGNHLLDYSAADVLMTLDMYEGRGWRTFGGGRDLQASLQPALVEHNGNRLAFIGCNYAGPVYDWATESNPGSTPCDFETLTVEISRLRSDGYLPITTFQYIEFYQPEPTEQEMADFRRMAEAGAVIVSGSQAHEPAAMEFYQGTFLHYGLGNLFFDQMFSLETRQGFVDRHIFYNGKYINTELVPILIEDYARPRLMTDGEREEFLHRIFSAAGW